MRNLAAVLGRCRQGANSLCPLYVTFLVLGGQGESMGQPSTLEAPGKAPDLRKKGSGIRWERIASRHPKDEVNFQITLTVCLRNNR